MLGQPSGQGIEPRQQTEAKQSYYRSHYTGKDKEIKAIKGRLTK
jgi:hypothetical protein